jgi:hypothetical protein
LYWRRRRGGGVIDYALNYPFLLSSPCLLPLL